MRDERIYIGSKVSTIDPKWTAGTVTEIERDTIIGEEYDRIFTTRGVYYRKDLKKDIDSSYSSSSNSCEYNGLFSGLSISPASELDRQTLNRWTKEESLVERWNKLR